MVRLWTPPRFSDIMIFEKMKMPQHVLFLSKLQMISGFRFSRPTTGRMRGRFSAA
jgi:hypothetical protein